MYNVGMLLIIIIFKLVSTLQEQIHKRNVVYKKVVYEHSFTTRKEIDNSDTATHDNTWKA